MATTATTQDRGRTFSQPLEGRGVLQTLLLSCGVLAALLYISTDIIGGVLYEGYRFTSQAISELGAIGSPSKPFVDPLFFMYDLLALAFAIGVVWTAGRNRGLKITGVLLGGHAGAGVLTALADRLGVFSGSFAMHQRGTGTVADDLPHIVLTGAIVVFVLLAMGFGAFALGRRFRAYTLATLAVIIAFTSWTALYAVRLAAGESTMGMGVVERVTVYAMMLWFAALATILLRRPIASSGTGPAAASSEQTHGFVAPGFEEVRAEFERNFAERGEIGAAVAAYWRGEKVVDLWGGRRTPNGDAPWNEDTMVIVFSSTKGLAAMTLAVANARGWLDYDAPIARYWPEFAQNGKAGVTVRQLLGHEAGLVVLDEPLTFEKLRDLDFLASVLARQTPAWEPGTRHGYHALTLGFYMQELIRRVDPRHRTLGRFFHEEIATPLGLEFYIGLPREVPDERIAVLKQMSFTRALVALRNTPPAMLKKVLQPGSLLRRSLYVKGQDWNDRRWLEIEIPAGNGVGTARSIARAYSAFAEGGREIGITTETLARITAPPIVADPMDVVIGLPSYFSLGFLRPGPEDTSGLSPRALGAPGAGGSFAFADPDARLGYAYVMNKLDFWLFDDPREKALRDAIYRAIACLAVGPLGGGADTTQIAAVPTAA